MPAPCPTRGAPQLSHPTACEWGTLPHRSPHDLERRRLGIHGHVDAHKLAQGMSLVGKMKPVGLAALKKCGVSRVGFRTREPLGELSFWRGLGMQRGAVQRARAARGSAGTRWGARGAERQL